MTIGMRIRILLYRWCNKRRIIIHKGKKYITIGGYWTEANEKQANDRFNRK